jgi:hypothetical protein
MEKKQKANQAAAPDREKRCGLTGKSIGAAGEQRLCLKRKRKMPRIPTQIGELTFATKKAAKEFFKEMLNRYNDYETVDETDAEYLHSLIERHPEAKGKIGSGIDKFYKATTDKGTSCFWLERKDSSTSDFSYISCVDAKSKSLYQEFAEACRAAVQPDLHQAKVEHFEKHGDSESKVPCDITGEMISWEEAHLDHKKPITFQVIVRTFVTAYDIEISPEMLSMVQDAQFTTTFVDKELERKFKAYHHKISDLRVIKAKKNLSLGGSERITKAKRPVIISSAKAET